MAQEAQDSREARAIVEALARAQAVIEFAPNGVILTANDTFLAAVGYALHEIKGKHHRIFVEAAEHNSPSYLALWPMLARGEHKVAEVKRVTKSGAVIWIQAAYIPILDADGKVYKVVKFCSDVTARKQRDAEFESQIAAINRAQAVITFNPDGVIVGANPVFLSAVGYSLSEIVGQHHSIFMEPSARTDPEYLAFWTKLGRGEPLQGEYRRFAKGGREIWISATYNPILDATGRPYRVVKFARDITREVEARRALQNSIGTVKANVEQLSTSIRDISQNTTDTSDYAKRAATQVESADALVKVMSDNAQAMTRITDAINQVTSKINLLALNATIESARAGEAGRGFAVVAAEVKTLANQVKLSSDQIDKQIRAMQESVHDFVVRLQQIKSVIDSVSTHVESSATAAKAQSLVTGQLASSMHDIANSAAALVRSR